jgi:hypothetical protein
MAWWSVTTKKRVYNPDTSSSAGRQQNGANNEENSPEGSEAKSVV